MFLQTLPLLLYLIPLLRRARLPQFLAPVPKTPKSGHVTLIHRKTRVQNFGFDVRVLEGAWVW